MAKAPDQLDPIDLEPIGNGSRDRVVPPGTPLLEVKNLTVEFPTDDGIVHAVDSVSFKVDRNETLGIVGESGSGKSVTSMAILGLLPKTAKITGEVIFQGESILGESEKELADHPRARGSR